MLRNAVILAAGTSSRFVPLSQECPKGLLDVKGEVLIERQIRQLKDAGIDEITVVVGYMAEKFEYLKDKFGVKIILNEDFSRYNNTSSLIRVLDLLNNTYICSSDNYFPDNLFLDNPKVSYYSSKYATGETSEYCLQTNENDEICDVTIGGHDSWYMMGHVYFSSEFSEKFKTILKKEYEKEETRKEYWEDVYIRNIDKLPKMHIRRFGNDDIEEFDSLEELRQFDKSYIYDTRSSLIKNIAIRLESKESELVNFRNINHNGDYLLFSFENNGITYQYNGLENSIKPLYPLNSNPYNEQAIRRHLKEIFPTLDVRKAEFTRIGGMSNKNFKVTFEGQSYVLRLPGNGSEGMVERSNEEFNSMVACKIGVTPPVRYFNPTNGVKLTDFIENAETLTAISIQSKENMQKIAEIYRKVHSSGMELRNEFNIFREIKKYDKLIEKAGGTMYEGWENVRPKVMHLEEYLRDLGVESRPCHNDALYENFIKSEDGTIYLIDWEYSGMNDPMADFAALFLEAGFDKENESYILEHYFDHDIPDEAREKILCYQILWDYLWAQWTVIKEAKGDDFGTYGIDRFNRAILNLTKIKIGTDN